MTRKRKGRGGKRPGCGRHKLSNIRCVMTLKPQTKAKLERLRKSTPLWKRAGQVVDELVAKAKCEGEREIYKLAAEMLT